MEFRFETNTDVKTVGYGDVLIMKDGSKYLIVKDHDGSDYMAVDLNDFETTSYESTIERLVVYELGGEVSRIIKSENIVMGVR